MRIRLRLGRRVTLFARTVRKMRLISDQRLKQRVSVARHPPSRR
ncbi:MULTISPECIES: hypothetical protein [unclassified Bradyrhizobium]|nr:MULTISPECIES: hypothetical protein [unclassified Bradyrhizobium]